MTDLARYPRASMLGAVRAGLGAAWICLLIAPAASAQVVRGRVVEAVTEKAVAGATLRLLDADGLTVAMAIAGPAGGFHLMAPHAAVYALSVEHIGYASRRLESFAVGDEPAAELVLRLATEVIPLSPLEVEIDARVRKLERAGFYDRRRLGVGTFLDRADIEQRPARTAGDVLRRVAGLRLVIQGYFTDVYARGMGSCRPGIYIDGALVSGPRRTVTSFNLEDLPAPDLEAIEVYPGAAAVPPQYTGGNSLCGIILFWTRKPGT